MANLEVPRKDDESLREFVLAYCDGRLFTSADVPNPNLLGMVFMPLALGGLRDFDKEFIDSIGLIYEEIRHAEQRAINGMPTFLSCAFLHKDDWKRAQLAIQKELERRKNIEL